MEEERRERDAKQMGTEMMAAGAGLPACRLLGAALLFLRVISVKVINSGWHINTVTSSSTVLLLGHSGKSVDTARSSWLFIYFPFFYYSQIVCAPCTVR